MAHCTHNKEELFYIHCHYICIHAVAPCKCNHLIFHWKQLIRKTSKGTLSKGAEMKWINKNVHCVISDTPNVQSSAGAPMNYLPEQQKTQLLMTAGHGTKQILEHCSPSAVRMHPKYILWGKVKGRGVCERQHLFI